MDKSLPENLLLQVLALFMSFRYSRFVTEDHFELWITSCQYLLQSQLCCHRRWYGLKDLTSVGFVRSDTFVLDSFVKDIADQAELEKYEELPDFSLPLDRKSHDLKKKLILNWVIFTVTIHSWQKRIRVQKSSFLLVLLVKIWWGQVDYPSLSVGRVQNARRTRQNSEIFWTLRFILT